MKIFSREKVTSSYILNYFYNRKQNHTKRLDNIGIITTFKGIKDSLV